MTTEQFQRIFNRIETPLAINVGVIGFLILLKTMGWITIPELLWKSVLYYASLNLLAAPFAIKNRFVTPNIDTPKCHYCGSYMSATELKCPKCNAISKTE